MASTLFLNKASKEHAKSKPTGTTHFKTSKQDQTAPVINNASIYRANVDPTHKQIDNDDDDDMIVTSYQVSDYLHTNQEPTFVDVLKHRRDHLGRVITKHSLNTTKSRPNAPTDVAESSPIKHTSAKPVQAHTVRNDHKAVKTTPMDASDESDDESSEDFDMDNLMVPKVTPSENVENVQQNEADDIREKFKKRLQLQKEEEAQNAPVVVHTQSMNAIDDDESENESDASSEYETATDSESESESEEHEPIRRKRKVVFLNKKQREAYSETMNKPSLDEHTIILEEMEVERQQIMKQDASDAVLDYIRDQEKQQRESGDKSDDEMPDDNDDLDAEETRKAFEEWKLREIKRTLRDETARTERETDKKELERRRKMTDDEIMRENDRLGLNKEKKKGTMKFMQKYYHEGVFYRDGSIVEDKVLDRNFNAATGVDKYINYEKVPEAMRRKNFGKMSQSKWTHLANEDTTFDKEEREWFKKRNDMSEDQKKKMKKGRYQFRHKAHQDNFWFQRGGNGALERPSYKNGNIESANRRFERKGGRSDDRKGNREKGRGRDRSKSPYRKSRRHK